MTAPSAFRHHQPTVCESLESRSLLAAAPLFLDFGGIASEAATYTFSGAYSASPVSHTTPAHQDIAGGGGAGLSGSLFNTYNNVGMTHRASGLKFANGAAANNVTLTWGRSPTAGGTIAWGTLPALSTATVTTAGAELNHPVFRSVSSASTSANGNADVGVRIAGLAPGTYTIYLINQNPGAPNEQYATLIGKNVGKFDPELSRTSGALKADGQFSSPTDYTIVRMAINAGDNLDVVVRGLGAQRGTAKFNLIEIVPDANDTTQFAIPGVGGVVGPVGGSAGDNGARNTNAIQEWLGGVNGVGISNNEIWTGDFIGGSNWSEMAYSATTQRIWGQWANDPNHSGRKAAFAVKMFAGPGDGSGTPKYQADGVTLTSDGRSGWSGPASFDDGLAGKWDSVWRRLANIFVEQGLGDTVIRLGWEMDGTWYSWSALEEPEKFAAYFRHIVHVMRSVAPDLQFCWNPGASNSPVTPKFDAYAAYPGDDVVDLIGLDFYDWDAYIYPSTNYNNPPSQNQREIVANRFLTGPKGLNFWADFARNRAQPKPLVICEWGTADRVGDVKGSGLDNATFVQMLHSFASDPINNVAWSAYFNRGGDGNHQIAPYEGGRFVHYLDDGGTQRQTTYKSQFPVAATKYQQLNTYTPTSLANNWDVGGAAAGGAWYDRYTNGWTVVGGGSDIFGTADHFRFAGAAATGDTTIVARVTSLTNEDPFSKAGIMLRDGTTNAAGAAFANVVVTPTNGLRFTYRPSANAPAQSIGSATVPAGAPTFVKLVRVGNIVTAYYAITTTSPDAADWKIVGKSVTLNLAANYQAGLAVTSHNTSRLATATFTHFSITKPGRSPAANGASDAFGGSVLARSADVGAPSLPGGAYYANGQYTVSAGGTDINGAADQFHFASTHRSGDTTMITRVEAISGGSDWVKAGLMLRDTGVTDDAGARYAAVLQTPAHGILFQFRSGTSGGTNATFRTSQNIAGPLWLRLVRSGDNFSAYYATTTATPAAGDWVQIGGTATLPLSPVMAAGLAVTGHSASATGQAVFSNLAVLSGNAGVAAPVLLSTAVNGGGAQRSIVNSWVFTFDRPVAFDSTSIVMQRRGGSSVTSMSFSLVNASKDLMRYALTFSDASHIGGSLPDGVYDLRIGTTGATYTFHRLFGDVDGNARVDGSDFVAFRAAYGTGVAGYNPAFDYNGDGLIDGTDFVAFRARYGTGITY
ncbi:MAG TPA: glycosyl hydrolase [Tepidisphaeraceae bacterium]|jgi:hypothetical protein|nr:glycosyl hydrolase [Tepidisphaeraceae bacterium]